MSTIFSELISSRNLFFKGESLSNFTSSVRRPTHRKKMDEDGETGIELVGTKVRKNRLFLIDFFSHVKTKTSSNLDFIIRYFILICTRLGCV